MGNFIKYKKSIPFALWTKEINKIILCYILERKLLIGMICLNLFIFSSFLNKFNLNLLFILGLAKINLQNLFINKCYVKLIIFKKIYYKIKKKFFFQDFIL